MGGWKRDGGGVGRKHATIPCPLLEFIAFFQGEGNGHRLAVFDGGTGGDETPFGNTGGDGPRGFPKHRFQRTRALHDPAKGGEAQGLEIRTTIGHQRGDRPSGELIVRFRHGRQGDGLALDIGIAGESLDGTPRGRCGRDRIGNLFKKSGDVAMTAR